MKTKAPHERQHREDYSVLGIIFDRPGLTTRQLAKACNRDYINNINKRAARWARRLNGWTQRKRSGNTYRWYPMLWCNLRTAQRQWRQRYET